MAREPQPGPEGERPAPTGRLPRARLGGSERARLREQLRAVEFPLALRGYERAAVDRYVEQAGRLIAELELSASPEAAVRHALAEVGEETRGLLERAHETAEEITARSRAKADDRLQRGAREADELRAQAAHEAQELRQAAQRETQEQRAAAARQAGELGERARREAEQLRGSAQREAERLRAAAEARVQQLERDAAALAERRQRLLDELGKLASQLLELAHTEAARSPKPARRGVARTRSADKPDDDAKPTATAEPPSEPPSARRR